MNQNGRNERSADYNSTSNRLGSNYDRYNPNQLQEFNNQNFGRNNVQNVFESTQFSVSQEPNMQYSQREYFLKVSSADRNVSIYPSSSNFVLDLPKEYKNVSSVELIQAIIPDKNNVTSEPYLLLTIDEFDKHPMDALDKPTSDAFALLLLTNPPLTPGSFISIDTKVHENTVLEYPTTPKAKLSKMTIKVTDSTGTVFDFGGSGTTSKATQVTFIFKITQSERSTDMLNTRNVY
jgi:hypothetical protein